MNFYEIKSMSILTAIAIILSLSSISNVEGVEGQVLIERFPLAGLHSVGSVGNENVGVLSSEVDLVDDNLTTPTSIDLSVDRYHNIGISVSSDNFVDRLVLYVNRDILGDTVLGNIANWKIFTSNFNQAGTWTENSIESVVVSAFDVPNNVYRYEIEFLIPQTASYFKAVNMVNSDIADVLVTEIEAYGIVPEPISYILFIVGGATLGFRRFMRRRLD